MLTPKGDLWQKAAIPGGLWAACEIILGSTLHNLHIPFSGTILAAISVALMSGFVVLWPEKGIIWRAGLIAALMKSISPSHLIFGPMIGIFTEAIFMELGLRFLGKNLSGLFLGGVLALNSALFHKIANLILLYGWDIMEIYINIYRWFANILGYMDADPCVALLFITLLYSFTGIMSAWLGYKAGMKATTESLKENHIPIHQEEVFLSVSSNHTFRFSTYRLTLHILLLPAILIALSGKLSGITLLPSLAYSAYIAWKYKQFVKKLRKPLFWIQLILVFIMALAFGNGLLTEKESLLENLQTGLVMVTRALVLVMTFSAISVELRSPVVKALLEKEGLKVLFLSIEKAFGALPYFLSYMPRPNAILKSPVQSFALLLISAKQWELKEETKGENP